MCYYFRELIKTFFFDSYQMTVKLRILFQSLKQEEAI